ncbi:phage tail protein I [Pyxidicoccus sp. 3LFB2]
MTSRYLRYLPAPLQEGEFLGQFLLAFESQLTGLDEREASEGIERKLDRIHSWFDPVGEDPVGGAHAPVEFLPWLASWVSVSLRDDWTEAFKRNFIRSAVSLHRKRGTREGMREMLELFLGAGSVQISDGGGLLTHYFRVVFSVRDSDPALLARLEHMVRALIDQQKPAHTFYGLEIRSPTLCLTREAGRQMTVGVNTVLGTGTVNS